MHCVSLGENFSLLCHVWELKSQPPSLKSRTPTAELMGDWLASWYVICRETRKGEERS